MRNFVARVATAMAVVAGVALVTLPANASTVTTWSIQGLGLSIGITVDGGYVTSVSGYLGNFGDGLTPGAISGLLAPPGPIGGGTNADNDNVWLPTAPYLTGNGFAFGFVSPLITQTLNLGPPPSLVTTTGLGAVLWSDGGSTYELFIGDWQGDRIGSLSISQTPIPATWAFMLIGLSAFGFLAYRGTKKSTALAAA